jgi:hypothetical protein
MEKHPNLDINAQAILVTGDADTETTLARACAAAAALMTNDVPVAIWQDNKVLFEYTQEADAPMGDDQVLNAVQGFAEDVIEAAGRLPVA